MNRMGLPAGSPIRHTLLLAPRRVALILLGACLVTSVGCASMHHGRTQQVIVTSEPPGARILADDRPVGVTPGIVTVNRRGVVLRLEKDGFLTEEIRMSRAPSGWLAGSAVLAMPSLLTGPYALLGLALTLGVDLGTGSAWKVPERVEAALEPAVETLEAVPVAVTDEMD